MALTNARKKAALDAGLASIAKVIWYKGTEGNEVEATEVAATACTLKAATTANPSVMANDGALESAAASAGVTVTAFAFAITDNTVYTTVNRLDSAVVLNTGGKITVVDEGLKEQLSHS